MEPPSRPALIEIPEQPSSDRAAAPRGEIKRKPINRQQTFMVTIDVEERIPADHKARAICDLTGRLDRMRFATPRLTTQGEAGRPAWDPRLLVSLWVYAYSEGIGSARESERRMAWNPAMQRLASLEQMNHHTVSDFRVEENRAIYRRRGEVAEFPNAWIKDKLEVRKFHVRGLVKAGSELMWACLSCNIMPWVRLVWRASAMA